jgi:hypothetical protein
MVPLNLAMLVLLLLVINWMTFSGEWWVQWAALGLGIAWAITVYRFVLINWMRSKAAWWLKWAVIALAVAWIASLLRVVRRMLDLCS